MELEKEKKKRFQRMKIPEAGSAMLAIKAENIHLWQFGNLTSTDLDTLLWWHNSLGVKMLTADEETKIME